MGFQLVTGEPITVEIGPHNSKLTYRPMTMKQQLAIMNKYDLSEIQKQDPEELAKDIVGQIDSLEGVTEPITADFMVTKLVMKDFFDIIGVVIASGLVDEEQEKN